MFVPKCAAFTLVLCVFTTSVYGQQALGDACQHKEKNVPGQCILLKDCAEAIADIRNQKYPQICAFQGTVPIVCCPKKAEPAGKVGDVSIKKCWEYGESVYKVSKSPVFSINRKPINESTCSIVKTTLVIGGENAKAQEFPHMVLLGYGQPTDKLWKCGGTLISEQFVLTAGHCLFSRDFGEVKFLRVGELNLATTNDASPEDFTVAEKIPHPEYRPPSRYNDIALLKMDRPTKFNENIRPACLHLTTEIPKKRFLATGWGLTQVGGSKGSDHLQKVVLDFFAQDLCNATYETSISRRTLQFGIVPESQLCAGGTDTEKDTCQGDSGGPLQIYHPEVHCMYSIVGVTSFGKTCGIARIPGVYSRVSHYIGWIEKTVWA